MLSLPGQSWGGSNHWGGSGWRAWSHGSSRHWQSCTWHHRSLETRPQSRPCRHWAWSSRPGRARRAPPNTRRGVTPGSAPGPGASAPAQQAWAAAGSTAPPRTADCSPVGDETKSVSRRNNVVLLDRIIFYASSFFNKLSLNINPTVFLKVQYGQITAHHKNNC